MNDLTFIDIYLDYYKKNLFAADAKENIIEMRDMITRMEQEQGKMIFAGNGASAAIASHCALDFTKQAGVRAVSFNDPSLITAFANDYGYEYWVAKAIGFYAEPQDIAVLVSSSGQSPNMINAAKYAQEKEMKIITFTGFSADNPLKQLGDLNFWVNSSAYNIIECTHLIWLTTAIDLIIGKAEYPVKLAS
ncbi:MAG: SIS domain-containing protein [Candidatus Aminicenantes bacterium]|jgi:D-sedoheptulose 7-phosphate isomerase